MTTFEVVSLVVSVLVLGAVFPLLAVIYYQLVSKMADLQRDMVPRGEFKAHMRRLDESNVRIERAMGILPRDRAYSQHDSEEPGR